MTRGVLGLSLLVVLARAASAEHLPLTLYGTANGLPHDRVKCIVPDSRGFLWVCTAAGLSRFDGERFVTYGPEGGLSHPSVNDVREAADGTYWVATNGGGVCRFSPGRPPAERDVNGGRGRATRGLFACLLVGDGLANRVNVVFEDRRGRLWAGTDEGLFHLDRARTPEGFVRASSEAGRAHVWTIVEDRTGDIWVGGSHGLARYGTSGGVQLYEVTPGRRLTVWGLFADRSGRLWIGHDDGLIVVRPLPITDGESSAPLWIELVTPASQRGGVEASRLPERAGEARAFGTSDGLLLPRPGTFMETSDGHVWIASEIWAPGAPGLVEFDGRGFRTYSVEHGLANDLVIAIAEDRERNLWLGTLTSGAIRLARGGLIAYGERDGLSTGRVHSMFRGHDGEFYVVTAGPWLHRFDGQRFVGVRPNIGSAEWDGFFQAPLQDRQGEWWVPTDRGLYRFPRVRHLEALAHARPSAVYGIRHGLPADNVYAPFEDTAGNLWFGVAGHDGVVRWDRATQRFEVFGASAGMRGTGPAVAFREDGAGNLWIGFQVGALARFSEGRFLVFRAADGVPYGQITTLHLDARGRLWIGSRDASPAYTLTLEAGGAASGRVRDAELARIDEPGAARPRIALYPAELLSGFGVRSMVADGAGLLYVGGDRGVQRLDPETDRVRRYTLGEGLPSEDVECAFRDADGALWFGTWRGLARMLPQSGAGAAPAPALIARLRIRGVDYPIPELGTAEVADLELGADQNQLEIEFFALAFEPGRPPRYQYRLEGVDTDWTPPGDQRRITYASLSPGRYRFLVRTVTSDSVVTHPAAISFRVWPPLWQRPWFMALAAAAAVLLGTLLHRARTAHLLAIERMRTRIATDLHDDIGASLSQIAVVSEVLRQQHPDDHALGEPLSRIAATSRELVDSMSDIVWAITPQRDLLRDLVQRMRRFASDALASRGITFTFTAPADGDHVRLDLDVRRHVFLIFKEAITNLARHSGAAHAAIDLSLTSGRLTLSIRDDGVGFGNGTSFSGHGLASMAARAKAIGGTLEIASSPGDGTSVRLEVPVGRARRLARRTATRT